MFLAKEIFLACMLGRKFCFVFILCAKLFKLVNMWLLKISQYAHNRIKDVIDNVL